MSTSARSPTTALVTRQIGSMCAALASSNAPLASVWKRRPDGQSTRNWAVAAMHRHPPLDLRPDRTILFDLDPELGLARARSRNRELGTEASEGRFERERIEFHRRVRDGYLALAAAEPFRFRIVAAEREMDAVEARVADLLADLFPCLDVDGFEDTP